MRQARVGADRNGKAELRLGFYQGPRPLINDHVIYFVAIVKFLQIIQLTNFRH